MKFLVVVAAFLAVASADAIREKRGILAGPSGTIITNPGYVASGLVGAPLLRSVVGPSVLAAPGLVAPGLVAPGLLAPSVYAGHGLLASPGVTAGTVVAPGTTLVGPSTNGAPGAVITNSIYGTQILV